MVSQVTQQSDANTGLLGTLSQSTGKSTVRRINVVETTDTTISQWPFHVEVVIGQSKNFLEAAYLQRYSLNGFCL